MDSSDGLIDPRENSVWTPEDERRWPHLKKPGPQPCNQIAATFEEQLKRAKTPRRTVREMYRDDLLELLAEPLGRLIRSVVREELEKWKNGSRGQ